MKGIILSHSNISTISIYEHTNNASADIEIFGFKNLAAQIFQKDEIKRVCSQVLHITDLPKHRHFLINAEHKLLYCWIHKVASTSWIALFSHLAHRTNIDKYYKEINILSPQTREQLYDAIRDNKYYKLIVVRHPFERIVSAYRDRIEDNSKYTSQAWMYVPRIFRVTRPMLRKHLIFNSTYHPRLLIVPTFQEFITWLIKVPPITYDVHWNRYFDHCHPCNIKYDAVVQIDHFDQHEELLLMHDMGLDRLNLSLKNIHKNIWRSN
ncbi:hypothetical protein L9F63_001714 [Diploptera punctata]|uniref:Carbohydrate sulfotransferase n=1 Tax=Diploptera punctata TaxID=6984 RepID=A0AAD8EIS5_DIPPU|nr:hypothetical protein L9F63_001714 [Diploptera punctata]